MTELTDIIKNATLYSSLWILTVLSGLLLLLMIVTLRTRRNLKRLEDDRERYSIELDNHLLSSPERIPDDFFSEKISKRYNLDLLTSYIQHKCLNSEKANMERVKEYARSCGLTERLRKRSSTGNPWKRAIALRILSEISSDEDVPFLKNIVKKGTFPQEILAASIGLANNGVADCIKISIEKVYSEKQPNRDEILALLSYFDESAVEPCIELVKDKSLTPPLRAVLIDFLGVRRARQAKTFLEDILKSETGSELNLHVIEALEKVGDGDSCDIILPYTKDTDFRVRLKAVNALERLSNDKYIDVAKNMLSDPEMFVRRNAAEAISRMGERGLKLLKELMTSKNRDIAVITGMVLAEKKYDKIRWRFRYGDSIP